MLTGKEFWKYLTNGCYAPLLSGRTLADNWALRSTRFVRGRTHIENGTVNATLLIDQAADYCRNILPFTAPLNVFSSMWPYTVFIDFRTA